MQSAREAARRMHCSNNLKQLGLAMLNYENTTHYLPNAGWSAPDNIPPGMTKYLSDYSPLARLLPYCEQDGLQSLIDFSIYPGHPGKDLLPAALRPAAATAVPMFLCPSDDEKPVHDLALVSNNSQTIRYAGSNYAMNAGDGTDVYNNQIGFMANPNNGICFVSAKLGFCDITDGTSNTVAFTESLRGPGSSLARGDAADTQVYRASPCSPALATTADNGGLAAVLPSVTGWEGMRLAVWLRGCSPAGPTLNGRFTPNSPIPDLTSGSAKITAARSRHPGGVNVCLCDGSVRFISDPIGRDVWHSLWTRAGGEPPPRKPF
ncbi:MAG: DUF1559 domain-containing protein [Planctomycetaceae bacterium]|nr:DUF1559 domain-containing protein [Planctomycetaceae bacterium]